MNCSSLISRSFSNLVSKNRPALSLFLSRNLTSDSLNGLLSEIPLNTEYIDYPRLTARQMALRTTPPKESQMLVRDFIDDSLYNPNYGYFSKQATIFSPQSDFYFNGIKDNLEFMNLVGRKYQEFEDSLDARDKRVSKQLWHTSAELFKVS